MIKYTNEQQQAIDYFDNNLLLSASAGSGKTQVLLEKVIKLVENGVDLSKILMVTFTNLAAEEMKSKLENMLNEKLSVDDKNSTNFFNALNKINSSDISTLHGFCQKLIREYYYLLNIEPDFTIGEESFNSRLQMLALNDTIKFYLDAKDQKFIEVSNLFVYKRDYSVFKEEILKFYQFLVSKQNKFSFIEKLIQKSYNDNINENEIFTHYRVFILAKLNYFKEKLKEIILNAKQIGSEKLESLASSFYGILDNNIKNNIDFVSFYSKKHEFLQVRIKNNAEYEEVELKENLQKLVKEIKETLNNLNKIFEFENIVKLQQELKQSESVLNKFVEIVKKFEENYGLLKRQQNCLDFNDLEVLTLKLFDNEKILEEISTKYKFIFVDEYQDTNSVQEEILTKISKYSKRIMVGDIKQSIYAFRECNPKIFSDKLKLYSEKEDAGKVILLNKNFRSKETILNFSNIIFSNLMREENSGYSYSELGKFIPGVKDENIDNTLKPVEILCIDKSENEENFVIREDGVETIKSENEKLNKTKEQEIDKEDLLVINSIKNLLDQKILENNKERNLTYKDIAIISRKRNDKIIKLCNTLDEFKIPYSVKYSEKIYASFEVKLILSYLKILNNLDNEISLFSVLKNIYGFTSNDLFTIKTTSVLDGLQNYSKKDAIFTKISRFFEDLHEFKELVGEISIKELVIKIVKKLNLDTLLIKTFGKIALERINVFINSIPNAVYCLSEFIIYFKELENKKFEVKKVTGENAITIDTFHATKGLEYNAVIIYSAGEQIFSKTKSNLIYNAKFGVGIYNFETSSKTKKPNIVYNMIKQLNKNEEFNEEVRLSYVAFTRAKNFLIIIGKEKLNNIKSETISVNFLNFNSYLSLIFSVSNKFNNKDFNIQILSSNNNIFDKINLIQKQISGKNESKKISKKPLEFDLFNYIKNKKYDFDTSKNIQLKNSVTNISEEDKEIYNISNFKLTDTDREDFIELGNAYHETLEKLPFYLKTTNEVRNSIKELIGNGKLSANVYNYVEDEKLLNAIKQIKSLISEQDKIYKEHTFMLYVPYNLIKDTSICDKILVQGVIDLFIEKEDEIILIDYKTSRLNDFNLIKKYETQLNLYALALKQKYKNKKITKYIYSIFLEKLINIV